MDTPKDGKSKFEKIIEKVDACLKLLSEYDFTFFSS